MELIILSSGGATRPPKPFCQCLACREARRLGKPYNHIKEIVAPCL